MHGLRKFLAKTGKCVFFVRFKSFILGASFDRSLPFFHVLFMESSIHIPNFRSLSQKLYSQENGQDRVQNISVCKVWKVTVNFILKKYFKKILFGDISHLLCSDNAFQALKNFSASKQYLYSHQNMIATKIGFFALRVHFGPLKLRYSQLLFYTFLFKIKRS